jgi:RNA polymerase sigma factor (sigma-70 family)
VPFLPLSADTYWKQSELLRPVLVSIAYKQVGHPLAHEFAEDAITTGFEDLAGFDAIRGVEGFALWMKGILGNIIHRHFRESRSRRRHEVPFEELRCEVVDPEYDAAHHARLSAEERVKKLQTIALKIRYANLSRMQARVMLLFLQGLNLQQTADLLGCAPSNVCYHKKQALLKIALVHVAQSELQAADLDKYFWRASNWTEASHVSIYHRPPTTGSQLAREDLKHCDRPGGYCSVTRKERVR